MGTLKEIEGRYFKQCNLVMLPNGKGDNFPILKNLDRGGGLFIPTLNYYYTKDYLISEKWEACHLYITSDDEIKEGDWCTRVNKNITTLCKASKKDLDNPIEKPKLFKIIATTDKSLGYTDLQISPVPNFCTYPQPSHNFIKAYCEQGGVDKVLVEYNLEEEVFNNPSGKWDTYTLKINFHNTITIKPIKEKMYTEKQVLEAFYGGYNLHLGTHILEGKDWIKENL